MFYLYNFDVGHPLIARYGDCDAILNYYVHQDYPVTLMWRFQYLAVPSVQRHFSTHFNSCEKGDAYSPFRLPSKRYRVQNTRTKLWRTARAMQFMTTLMKLRNYCMLMWGLVLPFLSKMTGQVGHCWERNRIRIILMF